jgi:hypothetical protein
VVYKVYSAVSARRFMCELADAHERGFLNRLPHYNSIPNYPEDPAVTPILHALIRISCLPLREVKMKFAGDSSGFCTSHFIRYFDVKYGGTCEEAEWVKVHLMCGVQTNIVSAAVVLDKHAADVSQLPDLASGVEGIEPQIGLAGSGGPEEDVAASLGHPGDFIVPALLRTRVAVGGAEEAGHEIVIAQQGVHPVQHLGGGGGAAEKGDKQPEWLGFRGPRRPVPRRQRGRSAGPGRRLRGRHGPSALRH